MVAQVRHAARFVRHDQRLVKETFRQVMHSDLEIGQQMLQDFKACLRIKLLSSDNSIFVLSFIDLPDFKSILSNILVVYY